MSPTVERPDPPYMQVARHIRQQIMDGVLAEGEMVPSARQIASDWNVSLATATKVLGTLRADGLVRAVPGVGTVVTAYDALRSGANDRPVSVRRRGRVYPAGEYAKILTAEVVKAPTLVAAALSLKPNARAIKRHRVRYRDDAPVSSSTSWFSAQLAKVAPALLERERITQGTAEYIAERTGRHVESGHDQLAATAADADAVAHLGVEQGSPVLLSRHWMYDVKGAVVEYDESCILANQWLSYEYETAD